MNVLYHSCVTPAPHGFTSFALSKHAILKNRLVIFALNLQQGKDILSDLLDRTEGLIITESNRVTYTPIHENLYHLECTASMLPELTQIANFYLAIMSAFIEKNNLAQQQSLELQLQQQKLVNIRNSYDTSLNNLSQIIEESRLQKNRLSYILEGTNVGTWEWNVQTNETIFNEQWAKIAGYTLQELAPISFNTWINLAHPEDVEKSSLALNKHFLGEAEFYICESRVRHKNGHWVWILDRGKVISWTENGEPLWMYGTHQDIHERKMAERALEASEKKFKLLIENIPSTVYMRTVAPSNSLLFLSESIFQLTGYSHSEFTNGEIQLTQLYHPEDSLSVTHAIDYAVNSHESFHVIYRIIKKDGSICWIEEHGVGVYENSQLQFIEGIFIDITERQLNADTISRMNDQLHSKNKELEQIIHVASHDLRAPLVNITGFSRELHESLNLINSKLEHLHLQGESLQTISVIRDEMSHSIRFIENSAAKMESLLAGLLKISRLGRAALFIEPINMNQLLQKVMSENEFMFREADASIQVGNLPECMGDLTAVNQVITNLVNNAIKYRNIDCNPTLVVSGFVEETRCVYCFADNGIGIAPKHHKRIFDMFYRLQPKLSDGDGLGLAIVQQNLERMGGSVWLHSNIGQGCQFFIALPKV